MAMFLACATCGLGNGTLKKTTTSYVHMNCEQAKAMEQAREAAVAKAAAQQ
jgi:hypothetical protein